MTDEAGVVLPGGDELAAAVADIDRFRELSLFDVALITQGMPIKERLKCVGVRRPMGLGHGWWDHEVQDLATN